MRIRNVLVVSVAVFACLSPPAHAELSVMEEAGVTVTRGVVKATSHKVDTRLYGADFTLPRDFRGPVFGKPLLYIEGQYQRRDRVVYLGWCCSRR